ncbi:hypothetical protein [Streptomyces sp. NPDC001889]
MNTTLRTRALTAAALTTTALGTLAACGNDTASGPRPEDTTRQVTSTAHAFMHAWMGVQPMDGTTMCTLQTRAARPNHGDDGGTLKGCIAERRPDSADRAGADDPSRPPLTITISHVQDVPASAAHPAGKGALATLQRTGQDRHRYALRLVKEDGQWRIQQRTDIDDPHTRTADPVAAALAQRE